MYLRRRHSICTTYKLCICNVEFVFSKRIICIFETHNGDNLRIPAIISIDWFYKQNLRQNFTIVFQKKFIELFIPKTEKITERIEGDVDSIVARMLDILKNTLKVI